MVDEKETKTWLYVKIKDLKKKLTKVEIDENDVLLLALRFFPIGAYGEQVIQDMAYIISDLEGFEKIKKELDFETHGDFKFSKVLHEALKDNCKDLSSVGRKEWSTPLADSTVVISDTPAFEQFEAIKSRELHISDMYEDYSPRKYLLTNMGFAMSRVVLKEKLNSKQTDSIERAVESMGLSKKKTPKLS